MVYAIQNDDDETQDAAHIPCLAVDDIISMEDGVTISPNDSSNYDPNDEGMDSH